QTGRVHSIELSELRREGANLVRRAEAGETLAVTVDGREVALLGPIRRDRWRTWAEVSSIFAGPDDPNWGADRDRVEQISLDPFAG
ncbi:MAG: type II toxin-antitoxin system prevent-host-death family antitoxin, partial [Nakamurella sp.]